MFKAIKQIIRTVLPLSWRKRLALWLNRRQSIDSDKRQWWSFELLRDFAEGDIEGYHKFLWSHHLAYASSYEVEQRFGEENVKPSREMFFSQLKSVLQDIGCHEPDKIDSIYEVGCSLGYQLRHLETAIFPGATVIEGMDIDEYAIDRGAAYLSSVGSRIELACGDMAQLDQLLGDRHFDIIFCCGVLMYLEQEAAAGVVQSMVNHTGKLLAISGLAHPDMDNAHIATSDIRETDGTFIHNVDAMIRQAGGRVVARRWDGNKLVDDHSIYFIFATT